MKLGLAAIIFAFLLFSVPAIADEIYNNGPINGNEQLWSINLGSTVTDSFTVSGGSATLGRLDFGAWLFPGDVLESVEVLVTSEPFSGTTYFDQVVNLTQSGCSRNQYGYDVCTETGFFDGPTLPDGAYWLQLENGIANNAGDPVGWDENSGVGCSSPGCPSIADSNDCISNGQFGCIPSESFTLSSAGGTVTEPSSFLLFGSGVLGVVGFVRRRVF